MLYLRLVAGQLKLSNKRKKGYISCELKSFYDLEIYKTRELNIITQNNKVCLIGIKIFLCLDNLIVITPEFSILAYNGAFWSSALRVNHEVDFSEVSLKRLESGNIKITFNQNIPIICDDCYFFITERYQVIRIVILENIWGYYVGVQGLCVKDNESYYCDFNPL